MLAGRRNRHQRACRPLRALPIRVSRDHVVVTIGADSAAPASGRGSF
jgi:hypothetical protein